MDAKFADRMAEVGEISSDALNARWAAVVSIASKADSHAKARLVLLACRDRLNRDEDEWFWMPFRQGEETFRVDDAVETHARLAQACARHLIAGGDELTAMLVKLAVLSGLTPVGDDLPTEASSALEESYAEVPDFEEPESYWFKKNQDVVTAEGGASTTDLGTALDTVAISSQSAIGALAKQVLVLTRWAQEAEQRFGVEQEMVQWLLAGARSDGVAWDQLSPTAIAIDAASELSDFVLGAPQPRHEAVADQVLAVAGVKADVTNVEGNDWVAKFEPIPDPALAQLAPLTQALATGSQIQSVSPFQLARRLLWEASTIARWDAG